MVCRLILICVKINLLNINKFVKHNDKTIMLQATSIYTQGNGENWDAEKMFEIMIDISITSLNILGSEIFNQITNNKIN